MLPSLPRYQLEMVDNYFNKKKTKKKIIIKSIKISNLPVWKNSGQQNSVVPPKLFVYISGWVIDIAEPK